MDFIKIVVGVGCGFEKSGIGLVKVFDFEDFVGRVGVVFSEVIVDGDIVEVGL